MDKALSLLGLARRAGMLSVQSEEIFLLIRSGKVRLLLLAEDMGATVRKKYEDKSKFYGVPILCFATRNSLGKALGLAPRSAVAVLDEGFAQSIYKALQQSDR